MDIFRVVGPVSGWNAIKIKFGKNQPDLFLKISSAVASSTHAAATVYLTTMELRFLQAELDAFQMEVGKMRRS